MKIEKLRVCLIIEAFQMKWEEERAKLKQTRPAKHEIHILAARERRRGCARCRLCLADGLVVFTPILNSKIERRAKSDMFRICLGCPNHTNCHIVNLIFRGNATVIIILS